jgi:hypothetical protein
VSESLLNESGVRVDLAGDGRVALRIGSSSVELTTEAFSDLVELLKISAGIAGKSARLRAMRRLTGLDGPIGLA